MSSIGAPDGLRLAFTASGIHRVAVATSLVDPAPVLQARNAELRVLSLHELLQKLLADGWAWEMLPNSKRERNKLFYEPGQAKIFYIHPKSLPHRLYLIALLRADALNAQVPHCTTTPAQTYATILSVDLDEVPAKHIRVRLEPDLCLGEALPVRHDDDDDDDDDDAGEDCRESLQATTKDALCIPYPREGFLHNRFLLFVGCGICLSCSPHSCPHTCLEEVSLEAFIAEALERGDVEEIHEEADAQDDDGVGEDAGQHALAAAMDPAPQESPDAEVPQADVAFNAHMLRFCKEQSWGHFTTWVWRKTLPGRVHGAIEVTCPYHKKSSRTSCKKACSLRGRSQRDILSVVWALRNWCNSARQHSRQAYHIIPFQLDLTATPPHESIRANQIAEAPPSALNIKTDEELDVELLRPASAAPKSEARGANDAPLQAPRAKAKSNAKAKAGVANPKAKGKAKSMAAKAKPVAAPVLGVNRAPQQDAGEGRSSSSSSSSSSDSSSSSSS